MRIQALFYCGANMGKCGRRVSVNLSVGCCPAFLCIWDLNLGEFKDRAQLSCFLSKHWKICKKQIYFDFKYPGTFETSMNLNGFIWNIVMLTRFCHKVTNTIIILFHGFALYFHIYILKSFFWVLFLLAYLL